MTNQDSFMKAFSGGIESCVGHCNCGKVFYNPDIEAWDFEDGELEELEANEESTAVEYPVGFIRFEGNIYVADCSCWFGKAAKIIKFIDSHDIQVVKYLKKEKQRRLDYANRISFDGLDNG